MTTRKKAPAKRKAATKKTVARKAPAKRKTAAQSAAQKKFAANSRKVAKLMKQGYTQKQAWKKVKNG